MSKAYLFAIMLLFVPFTGCLETEESEPSLRESVDGLIDALNTSDGKKYCSYMLEYDGTFLTIYKACNFFDSSSSSFFIRLSDNAV